MKLYKFLKLIELFFFKYESKRGECALHYNLHTLSPIMSTLWNLNLQGVDFTKVNLNNTQTIDDIISVMIDAYDNPMIVIKENKRLGYNQEGRDTCGQSDTIKLEEFIPMVHRIFNREPHKHVYLGL